MHSGKIFDHKIWPEELTTYGEDDLRTLATHFQDPLEKHGFNLASAEQEWATMKVFIHSNLNKVRYDALWQRMLTEHEQDYPNIVMLVELILILPMSTACCERGFSALKRVKNDWRSSLSSTSLNSILRIVIDGPSVNDFCPNSALRTWWESSQPSRLEDFVDFTIVY